MSDGRKASPLIRKGQAVLWYASAMDREHCACPIERLRTCHSYVTKPGLLNAIEKVTLTVAAEKHFQRASFSPSDHNIALTHVITRPFTHTKSVVRGRARP